MTPHSKFQAVQHQAGLTLIEVLITLLVFSIGLMGAASMQVTGLRMNQSAHFRTMAVVQANDLADRIRANSAGVAAGGYDELSNVSTKPQCDSQYCSPEEIAQYDAHEWRTSNAKLLPMGTGSVERTGSSDVFRIRVMWKDDRTVTQDSACVDEEAGQMSCFTMEFEA